MPFVYIARCADATLYIGHTTDLSAREAIHNAGTGASYTAARRPVRIVYFEEFPTVETAKARERQLKGWTVTKKEALVSKDPSRLKGLVKRLRNPPR